MNTLTGPATSEAVQAAGTMGFADATIMTGTLARTTSAAATNASQQLASQTLAYAGAYSAVTFVGGGVTGIVSPTDFSSLTSSGNPLLAPFEAGNLAGSLVGNTYNSISDFFNQPVSTNLK